MAYSRRYYVKRDDDWNHLHNEPIKRWFVYDRKDIINKDALCECRTESAALLIRNTLNQVEDFRKWG